MNTELTKNDKMLLTAKNPKEYIERSLKSNITPGRKAFITRHWLEKKKYTIEDIKYARNRHPYWKEKKMEGTAERNAARSIEHNYGTGNNILWDDSLILEFMEANKKDKMGNYINRDWELAKQTPTQNLRYKMKMAKQ